MSFSIFVIQATSSPILPYKIYQILGWFPSKNVNVQKNMMGYQMICLHIVQVVL